MGNNKCAMLNDFIGNALTQENNNAIYAATTSRKRAFEAGASQSKAPVLAKPQYHAPAPNVRYHPL